MNRQDYQKSIINSLTWLSTQVSVSNKLNLTDINVHSENFYRDLLNLAFGYNLQNINIVEGLANVRDEFFKVYDLDFNLSVTPKLSEVGTSDSAIAGKLIVFTGSMQQGSRGDMEKQAKSLGAKVGKSVSGKTDLLVTGEKVGENKINAAREKGVEVITEAEYLELISNS